MIEYNFEIYGYEKKIKYIVDKLSDKCINMLNSSKKEVAETGGEILFEIATLLNEIDEVKTKKELITTYVKIENHIISKIEKIDPHWSIHKEKANQLNNNNLNNNNFFLINEEPCIDEIFF